MFRTTGEKKDIFEISQMYCFYLKFKHHELDKFEEDGTC